MGKKSRAKLERLINYRVCPGCGHEFKDMRLLQRPGEKAAPRPLDFAVCPECIQILRFDETAELRLPTNKDHEDLKLTPEIRSALYQELNWLRGMRAAFGSYAGIVWPRYVRQTLSDGKPLVLGEANGRARPPTEGPDDA